MALATQEENVFPEGVDPQQCRLSHSRPVWRLIDGRAVLVAYHVYRGPRNEYGKIPGVLGRSEWGLEIVVAISFLVFQAGLSFDKVCLVMHFFENLPLRKSQVDALLHQLARHWEKEFDQLCTLLANSAVVHADETSWSINSVWAFLSEKARLLFFGVHKDAQTLQQILDPATFAGILISDDASVYANFSQAQKCWAHLIRKAIKLTLECPDNAEYRRLADRLLDIYRTACRVQRDGRLSDAGRARKVDALEDEIVDLCGPVWFAELPPGEGPDDKYRLLCNELIRLLAAEQLFTFVTAPAVETPRGETIPVPGTNNPAEQVLRGPAQARDTGRTNKKVPGARRQTVISSVLESLRQYLPSFTLPSVVKEVNTLVRLRPQLLCRTPRQTEFDLPGQIDLGHAASGPGGLMPHDEDGCEGSPSRLSFIPREPLAGTGRTATSCPTPHLHPPGDSYALSVRSPLRTRGTFSLHSLSACDLHLSWKPGLLFAFSSKPS